MVKRVQHNNFEWKQWHSLTSACPALKRTILGEFLNSIILLDYLQSVQEMAYLRNGTGDNE